MQQVLILHGLGTRPAGVGALAALTAATPYRSSVTPIRVVLLVGRVCGRLVGPDAFYVDKLEGIV